MSKIYKIYLMLMAPLCLAGCSSQSYVPTVGDDASLIIKKYSGHKIVTMGNHIFVENGEESLCVATSDGKITNSNIFCDIPFDTEAFESLSEYSTPYEVVSLLGMPDFVGLTSETSLDFAESSDWIYRVSFVKKGEKLVSEEKQLLDKDDPTSWLDPEKTNLPSIKMVDNISLGMSVDELVCILGKPQRETGSGAILFEFNLSNSQILFVRMENNSIKENEYATEHDAKIYGTHYLYIAEFWVK